MTAPYSKLRSHNRHKHCMDRHTVEYIPITHHVSSTHSLFKLKFLHRIEKKCTRVHTSQRSWAVVLSQLNLLGKLSVFRRANWSGVSTSMCFCWWAFLLQDFVKMHDQRPCKAGHWYSQQLQYLLSIYSCSMGRYYMSNGSEYISSTHPPVQLHSNVPKPWLLDSILPYQLVKQHSSKSACLIRCIRSNKYSTSLISRLSYPAFSWKPEIKGAVYTYNYTATGVMNGSHSGLTHKSLHLEVLLVSWVILRLLTWSKWQTKLE